VRHCHHDRDFSNGIPHTELKNRDARDIHLKLDEVIRSIQPAHNEMINIEKLFDEELQALSKQFEAIRAEGQARTRDSQPSPPLDSKTSPRSHQATH